MCNLTQPNDSCCRAQCSSFFASPVRIHFLMKFVRVLCFRNVPVYHFRLLFGYVGGERFNKAHCWPRNERRGNFSDSVLFPRELHACILSGLCHRERCLMSYIKCNFGRMRVRSALLELHFFSIVASDIESEVSDFLLLLLFLHRVHVYIRWSEHILI